MTAVSTKQRKSENIILQYLRPTFESPIAEFGSTMIISYYNKYPTQQSSCQAIRSIEKMQKGLSIQTSSREHSFIHLIESEFPRPVLAQPNLWHEISNPIQLPLAHSLLEISLSWTCHMHSHSSIGPIVTPGFMYSDRQFKYGRALD